MHLASLWVVSFLAGTDVTSAEGRRQNLLDYLESRQDLSAVERGPWLDAVKLAFGGKALKDGTDEGVTVAKSVLSGAIFFGVEPKRAAQAAYEAYHDTYRFVPPPIAINYQILVFQGRKPKASARELAFNFPRFFNEDLAPELASWWDEQLRAGTINPLERPELERLLAETRDLMRPLLREHLYRAVLLEARVQQGGEAGSAAADDLEALQKALARDFRGVGRNAAIGDAARGYYGRYAALCQELGETPQPPPAPHLPEGAPSKPGPPVAAPPSSPPSPPAAPKVTPVPPPEVFLERQAAVAEERESADPRRPRAPVAGERWIVPPNGWLARLGKVVQSWIGTPYLWGGASRRGIDCSAFTRQVYRETFGVELPRNGLAQAGLGLPVRLEHLAPGDLVFFDTLDRGRITHVAVFVGQGEIAHASSTYGVSRAKLAGKYYQRAYRIARALVAR